MQAFFVWQGDPAKKHTHMMLRNAPIDRGTIKKQAKQDSRVRKRRTTGMQKVQETRSFLSFHGSIMGANARFATQPSNSEQFNGGHKRARRHTEDKAACC